MSSTANLKNLRVLLTACLVLVVFNIIYFFHVEGSVSESVVESTFKDHAVAHAMANQDNQKPEPTNEQPRTILRKYFDDRDHGLVVISSVHGEVEDDDFETRELEQMIVKHKYAEDEKFEIITINAYDYSSLSQVTPDTLLDGARKLAKFKEEFMTFMSNLMKTITAAEPACSKINNDAHYLAAKKEKKFPNREGRIPVYGGHWRESYKKEPVRNEEYLLYFFRPTETEIQALTDSHLKFVAEMPESFPAELKEMGQDESFMRGDGIVYLGGGRYNQLVLISISMLRALGSKLPVEVIIPKRSDHDIDLCSTILPAYNGKCKIMEDYLPELLTKNLGGFQLKNAALLVSSFKNILYLDADNIPTANPDYLFVNEPFLSKRMIMWPDLWRRSTSPSFYRVAGITYNAQHRVRNSFFKTDPKLTSPDGPSFHDCLGTVADASSETGQMMIDKEAHFSSLILSMYYNYYGPDYYYPLLSQGAAGEGDKETFIMAAHKLGHSYYQVNEFNREFGPVNSKKKHEFFGMGQYNAIIDYIESERKQDNAPEHYPEDENDVDTNNYEFHYHPSYALMFLHANWPKYYISEMFLHNGLGRGHKDDEGKRRRLYTDYMKSQTDLIDIEVEIMRHIKYWFCNRKVQLQDVPGPDTEDREKICKNVLEQIQYLQG